MSPWLPLHARAPTSPEAGAPRRCILRGSEPRGTIRPAVVAQARQQSEEKNSGINSVTKCGRSSGDRKPSFFVTCRYPPRFLSIGSCQQCVHFRLLISERASVCACNIVLPCLPATSQRTWVGALMYADDLALLARSPGELQLMMNIITQYAKKWRFEINPTKTKILCFAESPEQESERIAEFGSKWRCGGHIIDIAPSYVYLGVPLTPDLEFNTHISQLKYKLETQKREAILLGVKSGVLPVARAISLWKQYVEPKFAYACALWITPSNKSALQMINKIQCEGAKIILGISAANDATTEPPPCALLREAGLHPAHVLHARFNAKGAPHVVAHGGGGAPLGQLWPLGH